MKYNKIQNDIINAWFKAVEKNSEYKFNCAYRYEKDEENKRILICVEGHVLYAIPKVFFKLDTDSLFDSAPINANIILKNEWKANTLNFDYELPWEHRGKKATLTVLTNSDGEKIYVNKAMLKYFDGNMTFKGTTPKEPVYVYEGDYFVGLVLPINMDSNN